MRWPWQKKPEQKPQEVAIEELYRSGKLDYPFFRARFDRLGPYACGMVDSDPFRASEWRLSDSHIHENPEVESLLVEFSRRCLWELACELTPDNYKRLSWFQGVAGARFLLKACEHIERLNFSYIGSDSWVGERHESNNTIWYDRTIQEAIFNLVDIARFDPEDDPVKIVEALKQFKLKTLEAAWGATTVGDAVLLRAMGRAELIPLWEFIKRLSKYCSVKYFNIDNVRNDADPANGVVEIAAFRALMAEDGECKLKELVALMKRQKIKLPNTLFLLEAVQGKNRARVLERIIKRSQTAIKAYGVLPLESEAECLERYLFIKQFARESKQFGPQRQATEQAAAQAALTNLAQVAGYVDVTRLEWAMEARLSTDTALPEACAVGEYRLCLELPDEGPAIAIYSEEKRLKSVPDAVRKTGEYKQLRETVETLRTQAMRFRQTLETLMVNGDLLSMADLDGLCRLPMARPLLGRLIFLLDDAALALFDPETQAFTDLHEQPLPAPVQLRVAHPWHLHRAGSLADWQQAIIRRRIVQPFKQAFRELYLLTPAEEEAGNVSARFAGHVLDSRVATRLFQARGWDLTDGEFAPPVKRFPAAGIEASFTFPDAGHFLTELETVTSDLIWFAPANVRYYGFGTDTRLPLAQVPPVLFSEVMRDADLVVSVAQQGEEGRLSEECFLRRGELVSALIADLQMPNVVIDGHFARIKGTRANYRVHLGSAAIHIEPGNYLCIVPDRWGKSHDRLFLPFVDEGDRKVSEVISKVLLLANDAAIKDQSILNQIRR